MTRYCVVELYYIETNNMFDGFLNAEVIGDDFEDIKDAERHRIAWIDHYKSDPQNVQVLSYKL